MSGFNILLVSGGNNISNGTAERAVNEAVEISYKNNKSLLILSAGMAQRSFSIPKMTEIYLAYDSGDNGATIQKISRVLTPDNVGKIGRVISLSFDANRDDKFDAMLIETAQNYKKNKKIDDLKEALRMVLKTVDIFKCHADGPAKLDVDTYLSEALARNSIDRIIGKIAPLDKFDPEMIQALASGNVEVFRAAMKTKIARGKTRLTQGKNSTKMSHITASDKEMARAREMIVTISQNIDIIRHYGGATIDETFAIMDAEGEEIQNEVTEQFGVKYDFIRELILNGFVNRNLLELKF